MTATLARPGGYLAHDVRFSPDSGHVREASAANLVPQPVPFGDVNRQYLFKNG
jgi:hypothetical protein